MQKGAPQPSELRRLLDYDPSTGILTWKKRDGKNFAIWNSRYPGTQAGTLNDGYIVLKINNRNFLAHRVIWAMTYDCWPECIDHKNGCGTDNRLRNLRAVSRAINQRNQKLHSSNTSGIRGVSWDRFREKWIASVKIDGQSIYLGGFDDKEQAAAARLEAERKYNFLQRV